VGRDPELVGFDFTSASFNPRARVGRDDIMLDRLAAMGAFQSTRPRGARRPSLLSIQDKVEFQSTRPRGARRSRGVKMDTGLPVSIHAPAWGAT